MTWQGIINFGERVRPIADAIGIVLVPVVIVLIAVFAIRELRR